MAERVTVQSQREGTNGVLPPGSRIAIFCDGTDNDPKKSKKEGKKSLVNGVKTTVKNVSRELEDLGYEPIVIYPRMFRSIPLPLYPDLRMAVVTPKKLRTMLTDIKPDAVLNMSPEGALGYTATRACKKIAPDTIMNSEKILYTSVYTTNIDQYVADYVGKISKGRLSFSPNNLNRITRKIYRKSEAVLVPAEKIQEKLQKIGIENTIVWPHGVDNTLFRPLQENEPNAFDQYDWYDSKRVLLSYGRIAREKNYEDFLDLTTPGFHKVIIGDGPLLKKLKKRYENDQTHFLGKMHGEELAHHVRSAELMIFPSKTDTFGLVATEAAASGVPVVAYDVQGPGDVLTHGVNGILVPENRSLLEGIGPALLIDRQRCTEYTTAKYSWKYATEILLQNLQPVRWKVS